MSEETTKRKMELVPQEELERRFREACPAPELGPPTSYDKLVKGRVLEVLSSNIKKTSWRKPFLKLKTLYFFLKYKLKSPKEISDIVGRMPKLNSGDITLAGPFIGFPGWGVSAVQEKELKKEIKRYNQRLQDNMRGIMSLGEEQKPEGGK